MTTYYHYRQPHRRMPRRENPRSNRAVLWTLIVVIVGAALALSFGEASGLPADAIHFLG